MEFTAGALQGLPLHHIGGEHFNYQLPLHLKAKEATPFDHIEVNWNPEGHEPPGIYTLPHFDVHFYMISHKQKMEIPEYNSQTASMFDNYPPAGYLPADYIPTPGGVPQMGKHWVDLQSPEFNNQTFTKTFIFGTYNGGVIFYEPMVTKAYMESTSQSTTPIKQPLNFARTGIYYPTAYNVYRDGSNYYISLSGLEQK